MKREPKTASALPEKIGSSNAGYSYGIVFEVGILHEHHVARGRGEAGTQGRTLPLINAMEDNFVRQQRQIAGQDFHRSVLSKHHPRR